MSLSLTAEIVRKEEGGVMRIQTCNRLKRYRITRNLHLLAANEEEVRAILLEKHTGTEEVAKALQSLGHHFPKDAKEWLDTVLLALSQASADQLQAPITSIPLVQENVRAGWEVLTVGALKRALEYDATLVDLHDCRIIGACLRAHFLAPNQDTATRRDSRLPSRPFQLIGRHAWQA